MKGFDGSDSQHQKQNNARIMTHVSFIRYYIGDIPYSLARTLQHLLSEFPQLNDWYCIPVNEFDYTRSLGYLPGTNEGEIKCVKRHCTVIVEHHDPDAVVGSSLIWKNMPSSPATLIDDILTLCSIAKSQYIPAIAQEILSLDRPLRIIHRPIAPPSDLKEVILQDGLESFITDSLATLQQRNWKEVSGFIPAISWYAQAQRLFRAGIFGLEFSLYWIVLEILGLAYVRKLSPEMHKEEQVTEFLNSRGFTGNSWSFLTDAIEDWYRVRNYAFHEGRLPDWSKDKFEQRWRQLAEFVSLVFADLLQPQSEDQKEQIGSRLSGY